MHPNTRALVAAAAERLTAGGTVGPVYDHSRLKYVKLSGVVNDGWVSIFDLERKCQFVGSNGSFYDHGRGVQVLLRVTGSNFSGYDHGDGHHFSGNLKPGAVLLYDYGVSTYFTYSVTAQENSSEPPRPATEVDGDRSGDPAREQ